MLNYSSLICFFINLISFFEVVFLMFFHFLVYDLHQTLISFYSFQSASNFISLAGSFILLQYFAPKKQGVFDFKIMCFGNFVWKVYINLRKVSITLRKVSITLRKVYISLRKVYINLRKVEKSPQESFHNPQESLYKPQESLYKPWKS